MDAMATRDAAPLFGATTSAAPMLIDRFVDRPDTTIATHAIVEAMPAATFEAARTLDLLDVKTPLTAAAFAVRGIPEKVLRRPQLPPPKRLTLEGDLDLPGWMLLDHEPGRELVFGAVGVFWTPTIRRNTSVTPETSTRRDGGRAQSRQRRTHDRHGCRRPRMHVAGTGAR